MAGDIVCYIKREEMVMLDKDVCLQTEVNQSYIDECEARKREIELIDLNTQKLDKRMNNDVLSQMGMNSLFKLILIQKD